MKLRRKTINHRLLIHRCQNLHRSCQYETKNTSFIVIFVLISFRLDSFLSIWIRYNISDIFSLKIKLA